MQNNGIDKLLDIIFSLLRIIRDKIEHIVEYIFIRFLEFSKTFLQVLWKFILLVGIFIPGLVLLILGIEDNFLIMTLSGIIIEIMVIILFIIACFKRPKIDDNELKKPNLLLKNSISSILVSINIVFIIILIIHLVLIPPHTLIMVKLRQTLYYLCKILLPH